MNDQKDHKIEEEILDKEDMGTHEDDVVQDDEIIEDAGAQEASERTHKTYIAIIIVLVGFAVGSLFVDVAQLFSKKGFSARAIRDAQVIDYDGQTWVRFDDPKIVVDVFDAQDCEECVTDEVLTQLRTVLPTMEAHRIDLDTEEGKAYAKMHDIAHIPAFVFSPQVTETDFYQQTAVLFKQSKDKYYLDTASVGIPVGKYIAQPSATEGMLYGNAGADVQVVVFEDLTSPESKSIHDALAKIRDEYGDKIGVAVKFLADPEQKAAQRVALGMTCAYAQDKFDAFFGAYYTQRQRMSDESTVDENLKKIANTVRIDQTQFETCLNDGQKTDMLARHIDEAKRFGIQMLPTAFVKSDPVNEKISYETLKAQIDAAMGDSEGEKAQEVQ